MDNPTKYWNRYERGMDYIRRKNLITRTNRNWNFYSGNQWEGMESGGEKLPFLNFIKPTIKHKVSTVSQNNMVANYSDAEGREEITQVIFPPFISPRFSASMSACKFVPKLIWIPPSIPLCSKARRRRPSVPAAGRPVLYPHHTVSSGELLPNRGIF